MTPRTQDTIARTAVLRAIPRKDAAAERRVKDWLEAQPGYWLGRVFTGCRLLEQTENESEVEWLLRRIVRHQKRAEKAGGYKLAHEGDPA